MLGISEILSFCKFHSCLRWFWPHCLYLFLNEVNFLSIVAILVIFKCNDPSLKKKQKHKNKTQKDNNKRVILFETFKANSECHRYITKYNSEVILSLCNKQSRFQLEFLPTTFLQTSSPSAYAFWCSSQSSSWTATNRNNDMQVTSQERTKTLTFWVW